MSYTKRQFVNDAFTMIGLAHYTYDLQSEQLQTGLRALDAMMGMWNNKTIRLGYPISSSPENSDLDQETEVPDAANEAIIYNLACRIAPAYGKQLMPETKSHARYAYEALLAEAAKPEEMQYQQTLPRGAGNKPWRWDRHYYPQPQGPIQPWEK